MHPSVMTVGVVLVRPEQGVGDQEVTMTSGLAVIENVRVPHCGMDALPGIGMLVQAGAVETAHRPNVILLENGPEPSPESRRCPARCR